VKSLAAAAEQFRAGAKTQYSDVLAAARGGVEQSAVLSGIVEEARTVDHSTTVLLDVEEGCSARPCLAKIVYQQNFAVEKGAQLEALGVTRETMRSPFDDKQIPVLQAAFLLSKEAPKDHSRAKLPKAEGPATAAKASRGFGY
jgi:hypothetical protein